MWKLSERRALRILLLIARSALFLFFPPYSWETSLIGGAALSSVSVCVMERRRAAGQRLGLSAHSCPLMRAVWGADNFQRPDCVFENWFPGPCVQIALTLLFENVRGGLKSETDYVKTVDQHFKRGLCSVLVVAVFLFCTVYMLYVVFVMNVCWGFAFLGAVINFILFFEWQSLF